MDGSNSKGSFTLMQPTYQELLTLMSLIGGTFQTPLKVNGMWVTYG